MKCYNFLCMKHNPKYKTGCNAYMLPELRHCKTRKKYNRILKPSKNWWSDVARRFYEERDSYKKEPV